MFMLGWGSLSCLEANLRPLNFICWDNAETFFLWLNDTLTPYILVYCNCTLTVLPLRSGAELPRSWILHFWGLFRVYDAARLKYRVVWNLSKTTSDLRHWVTPRSVLLGCRNLASVLEQIFFPLFHSQIQGRLFKQVSLHNFVGTLKHSLWCMIPSEASLVIEQPAKIVSVFSLPNVGHKVLIQSPRYKESLILLIA